MKITIELDRDKILHRLKRIGWYLVGVVPAWAVLLIAFKCFICRPELGWWDLPGYFMAWAALDYYSWMKPRWNT